MTAKVTLSFTDETIEDARRYAERDGMSLSAWIDQAARKRRLGRSSVHTPQWCGAPATTG
jgi:hypothetical protein